MPVRPLAARVNSAPAPEVERPISSLAWVILLASTLLAAPGCFDVQGGAVELSWSLFDFEGDSVDCDDGDVAEVRLCWAPVGDDGAVSTTCRSGFDEVFECRAERGATSFELPEGRTAFWIVPLCADGAEADPGTFQVPAPIVREVQDGKLVTLSSLAIVVSDNSEMSPTCGPAGCTCAR